jgi:hypothetical protein
MKLVRGGRSKLGPESCLECFSTPCFSQEFLRPYPPPWRSVKAELKLTPPPDRQREYASCLGDFRRLVSIARQNSQAAHFASYEGNESRGFGRAYDRIGKKSTDIPNEKTSPVLRHAFQNTFQYASSPDHERVIAII